MYGTMMRTTKRKKRNRWQRLPKSDKAIYIFLTFVVIFMVVQCMRAPAGFWNGTYVPDNYSQRYDTGRLSGGYDDSINLYTPVSTQETQEDVLTTPEPKLISVGEFKLTAYCPCVKCCGKWSAEHPNNQYEGFIQKTAGGTIPKANHTIAADWSKLPKGTKVLINGTEYVVEDKGGVVKGNHIDIYFEDHQEALVFGVQYAEVFIIE